MNQKLIEKTHTLQLDQSDCGVACLLSIIKLNGGNTSLEKLRELSGTSKDGTTMLGLYQVANQLGFNAEGCEADMQALKDHGEPIILHILIENKLKHYIVCYNYDQIKGFTIGDPAKGILNHYDGLHKEEGLYNYKKVPFETLAEMQKKTNSVGWISLEHTGDHVELAAFGPGSELLKPFVKNTDLHYLMLQAAEIENKF